MKPVSLLSSIIVFFDTSLCRLNEDLRKGDLTIRKKIATEREKIFSIIATAYAGAFARGPGISGGDRILIECTKRWAQQGYNVHIIASPECFEVFQWYSVKGIKFTIFREQFRRLGFPGLYLARTIRACIAALRIKRDKLPPQVIIYSASDFWPDSIMAWILRIRFRKVKWVAGFYLFVSNPSSEESPYKGRMLPKGFFYYLSQMPVYYLVRRYADMVFVTNELDRWKFIDYNRLTPDRVIAVRGGVDTETPVLIPEPKEKRFDAVFIGRFHSQKGVLELIDIWRYVRERRKDAKLAMIGVGDLESEVMKKIKKYSLENNVTLFGFKDGVEKLRIFKDSRVVVHPAIYDSGGMAACEAMACGLPGVSFDLPALRTYYPKGMLKTPCFDLKAFAENILKLLNDKELYKKTSKDALKWAKEWDWDKRAEEMLSVVQHLFTY